MAEGAQQRYIAFVDQRRIAEGDLSTVARAAKRVHDEAGHETLLVFDAATSRPVELDLRGTADEVVGRLTASPSDQPSDEECATTGPAASPAPRPGRPKLGVVGKEVTLLPRHWEWLAAQPGGASVTLRKLVEKARRESADTDTRREACDSAYRFMLAMAGNEPGFEEATRALYAGDAERFAQTTAAWPADIREHARNVAARSFDPVSHDETAEG